MFTLFRFWWCSTKQSPQCIRFVDALHLIKYFVIQSRQLSFLFIVDSVSCSCTDKNLNVEGCLQSNVISAPHGEWRIRAPVSITSLNLHNANVLLAINLRDDPVTSICVASPRGRASHQLRDWWSADHPGYSHPHRSLHYLQVIAPQHPLARLPFSMNSAYHCLHLFRITIRIFYYILLYTRK